MKRSAPLKRKTPLRNKTPLKRTASLQRGAPLKRHTPLKAKRQTRTAAAQRHIARVGQMPCCVPGCGRHATVHHVTAGITAGRISRSDWLVVPLCNIAPHHQVIFEKCSKDPQSIEGLGPVGFHERYGINLLEIAERLAAESRATQGDQ